MAGLCGDGGPPIDTDEAHAGFLMAGHDMNDMTRPETDARSQAAEAVLLAFTSDALYEELAEVMPESVRRCSAAMRVALAALRAEVEVRGKESMSHHPM
ncbi:hypothetical protein OG948_34215 (plasmid) [Embleya sp. NBC_00888]|uniref:hypothetical protein n=1 Tax=Embleya sp. NBC_00888 TaxID=2975960 RepID=UPI002F90B1ED|nr:hypothetical protein OG948_34215 [Embleya sp. NBC_00888]